MALSTRGRGAHAAPSGVTTSFRPPRFRNVSGMWTVIVSPSAETVARLFTLPPSGCPTVRAPPPRGRSAAAGPQRRASAHRGGRGRWRVSILLVAPGRPRLLARRPRTRGHQRLTVVRFARRVRPPLNDPSTICRYPSVVRSSKRGGGRRVGNRPSCADGRCDRAEGDSWPSCSAKGREGRCRLSATRLRRLTAFQTGLSSMGSSRATLPPPPRCRPA